MAMRTWIHEIFRNIGLAALVTNYIFPVILPAIAANALGVQRQFAFLT
jgi:hypothetical protein